MPTLFDIFTNHAFIALRITTVFTTQFSAYRWWIHCNSSHVFLGTKDLFQDCVTACGSVSGETGPVSTSGKADDAAAVKGGREGGRGLVDLCCAAWIHPPAAAWSILIATLLPNLRNVHRLSCNSITHALVVGFQSLRHWESWREPASMSMITLNVSNFFSRCRNSVCNSCCRWLCRSLKWLYECGDWFRLRMRGNVVLLGC